MKRKVRKTRKSKESIRFEDLIPQKNVKGGKNIFGAGLKNILGRFNMVEIVVSLVIVMVALVGVMSMVPSSIERNMDAMYRSSAADAADQFLHSVAARIESDWIEIEAYPDEKPTMSSGDLIFSNKPLFEMGALKIQFEAPNVDADWVEIKDGIPEMVNSTGIFLVTQRTGANITDFMAEVRVWKEIYEVGPGGEALTETKNPPGQDKNDQKQEGDDGDGSTNRWRNGNKVIMAHYPPGQNGDRCHTLSIGTKAFDSHVKNHAGDHIGPCEGDLDADGELNIRAEICIINAEVSWPVNVPYEKRTKALYRIEIAKAMDILSTAQIVVVDEETPEDPEDDVETPTDDPIFTIEDGEIILNEKSKTQLKALGCALTSGSKDLPVTVRFFINETSVDPFGNASKPSQGDINDHQSHTYDAGILDAGSTIVVEGMSWINNKLYLDKKSNPSNQNVLVLKDGDSVPNIAGFDGQDDIEAYIKDYIDTTSNKVTLKPNQAILLFELGTTNMSSESADFQDLVILVTMTPQ